MYGIFDSAKGYSRRANIVIDEFRYIIFAREYQATTVPDMRDVLDVLQAHEKNRRAEEQVPQI